MSERQRVAILGTRYPDLSIEEDVLGPLGVEIVAASGSTPEDIVVTAAGAGVVLAGSGPRFTREVIERLGCKAIVRYGVGVESVDLDAAASHGMWVAYVPDYGTDAVATHTVMLVLAVQRRLLEADALVKRGEWGFTGLRPLRSLGALTVGIVGYGRIGKRVCELLAAFGCTLLAYDEHVAPPSDMAAQTLETLLERSDVVCLHAPGRADGRPLLGERELGRMRRGAVLINTARGTLVEARTLAASLRSGRLSGAGLDVFETEPPDYRFEDLSDRVVVTPHMAWYTEESERDLRVKAAQEAARVLSGRPPVNVAAGPSR
jgi:D-3-phosphoglycerate dehydrogenase